MDKNTHGFVSLLIGLLSVAILFLPACDTLEVNVIQPTAEVSIATATLPPFPTPPASRDHRPHTVRGKHARRDSVQAR